MTPARVALGKLVGVFGVRGELKCRPTAAGAGAFVAGRQFALGAGRDARLLQCTSARRHHERLVVGFAGVANPEDARGLVGAELYGEAAEIELEADEYLDADLIGLRLIDEDGRDLARVTGVRHFPAQDCLVVDPGEALVPLVKAFIRSVDVAAGTIVVTLPDGLI